MPLYDPKGAAEAQELADWQSEWAAASTSIQELIQSVRQEGIGIPNDMVIDLKIKVLIEFMIPRHTDKETDPLDGVANQEPPTNIERLQHDVRYWEVLAKAIDVLSTGFRQAKAQQEQQQRDAQLAQNGQRASGLLVAQPGEAKKAAEDILRKKGQK